MMEPSGERSVNPKVIVEYHNSENLEEFIQGLKGIYLEIDMNKKDAEEELAGIKEELERFMSQFNKQSAREPHWHMPILMSISVKKNSTSLIEENVPPLTSTSKLNQDPDIGSSCRLKLRSQDGPKIIRAYADFLGSLMQPTDRPSVDYLNMHEFTSSIAINILTLNHGNLTRNPKLDNREVCNMPMKDRPIVKMMMTHLMPE